MKNGDPASSIMEMEKYMPVMTHEQIRKFEIAVLNVTRPPFSDEEKAELERRLAARTEETERRSESAMRESGLRTGNGTQTKNTEELCRTK